MIDDIRIKGCIGALREHHSKCFDQVTFSTFDKQRTKQTTTYASSPLTGAQIELKPTLVKSERGPLLYVELRIPAAAALAGQNCIHGGLGSLPLELDLLSTLTRVILMEQGLDISEVSAFIASAVITSIELTWHVPTKSRLAALKRLRAVTEHLTALERIRSRHDVQLHKVDVRTSFGVTCVLAHAKNGCSFRAYIKEDQMKAHGRADEKAGFLSTKMRVRREELLAQVKSHLRIEVILGEDYLRSAGLAHPRQLRAMPISKVEEVIDRVLAQFRLARVEDGDLEEHQIRREKLTPALRRALAEYRLAGDVLKRLPDAKGTRMRQALLACGVDIALPVKDGCDPFRVSLSRQIAIQNSARFSKKARMAAVVPDTAPAIYRQMKDMLEHGRRGRLPTGMTDTKLNNWIGAQHKRLTRARMISGYRVMKEEWEGRRVE